MNFYKSRRFRTKTYVELFNNKNICLQLATILNHLHPLQVENCDSNSRLVVNEDDIGKFRLERVLINTASVEMSHDNQMAG